MLGEALKTRVSTSFKGQIFGFKGQTIGICLKDIQGFTTDHFLCKAVPYSY